MTVSITTRGLIDARVREASASGDTSRLLLVRSGRPGSWGDDIRTVAQWRETLEWEREHVASTAPEDRLCEERQILYWQEISREGALVGERTRGSLPES